jgi:hypothetical protein
MLPSFKSVRGARLQRKCGCGSTPGATGECEECRKKRLSPQRRPRNTAGGTLSGPSVPPIVRDVLRSPGQPLDSSTRAFMESRFGHSFSRVRVHDNVSAAESARAVNALAYTVAKDIVFAAGRYAPQTHEGRLLLAHELTHVLQQDAAPAGGRLEVDSPESAFERQADQRARAVIAGEGPRAWTVSAAPISVQRSCGPAAIGKPTGCTGVSGDVLGNPFLFWVGCDEFRTPPWEGGFEELNLKSFAATLRAGDLIKIHGFASIEGDPGFNDNLSCARAIAAQRVIRSANPARTTIQLFQHGATAGDRDERRSVIIERTPAPPPDRPAPAQPSAPEQPAAPGGAEPGSAPAPAPGCARNPGCPPEFCTPFATQKEALDDRAFNEQSVLLDIPAPRARPLYKEYIDGGGPPRDISAEFAADFTNSETTIDSTRLLVKTLEDALKASPPPLSSWRKHSHYQY